MSAPFLCFTSSPISFFGFSVLLTFHRTFWLDFCSLADSLSSLPCLRRFTCAESADFGTSAITASMSAPKAKASRAIDQRVYEQTQQLSYQSNKHCFYHRAGLLRNLLVNLLATTPCARLKSCPRHPPIKMRYELNPMEIARNTTYCCTR